MDTTATIAAPDECYRCGYDLRGIADDQACPECGLLAVRSRRKTDELHQTRPRWVRRLERGVWTILLSIFAFTVLQGFRGEMRYEVNTWIRSLRLSNMLEEMAIELFALLGAYVATVLLIVGIWLLTSPEGYPPADLADRRRRRYLRIASCLPLGTLIFSQFGGFVFNLVATRLIPKTVPAHLVIAMFRFGAVSILIALLLGSVLVPLPLFYQLRCLAKRARSAHLAEHCAIVGIGTTLSLMLITGFYLVTSFTVSGASQFEPSIPLLLTISVSSILFLFWSLYLLIRFAVAFHRAWVQLQRQWTRDDCASTEPAAGAQPHA